MSFFISFMQNGSTGQCITWVNVKASQKGRTSEEDFAQYKAANHFSETKWGATTPTEGAVQNTV